MSDLQHAEAGNRRGDHGDRHGVSAEAMTGRSGRRAELLAELERWRALHRRLAPRRLHARHEREVLHRHLLRM